MTYTISNICGGDLLTFRPDRDGNPSYASIRHAWRQGSMGYVCSDPEIRERIDAFLEDRDSQEDL